MRTTSLPALLGAALALSLAACESTTPSPVAEVFEADLQPGEARVITGRIAGVELPRAGEYLLVPLLAAEASGVNVEMSLRPEGGIDTPVSPLPLLAPRPSPAAAASTPADAAHIELQHRFRREVEPRLRHMREHPQPLAVPAVGPAAQEGDTLTLSVSVSCDEEDDREGRVVVRSDRALVVVEEGEFENQYSENDYRSFAAAFDAEIYPLSVENFGEPHNLDGSERTVIFFTRAVNELSDEVAGPGALIAGYVWQGDVLPTTSCASSNARGIFYMAVPDGEGSRRRANMLPMVEPTLAHELQHLVNAGRTIHVHGGDSFETVWMEEGLSHTAEELLFYRRAGLAPGSNLDAATLGENAGTLNAFQRIQSQNVIRLARFLEDPSSTVLIDPQVPLSTRGALWQFFRYAADRRGGDEAAFWRGLVNTTRTGFENLSHALGADPYDWIHDWAVSVYTDDLVDMEPRFRQPSWNFRSIYPALQSFSAYPLDVRRLTAGAAATLRTGAPVYYRFRVIGEEGGRITVERPTTEDRLRMAVVRLQ